MIEFSSTPARKLASFPAEFEVVESPIRIMPGPDACEIEGVKELLMSERFLVRADSDRAGVRLEGPVARTRPIPGRLSTPVLPGSVQYTGGAWIVLGVSGGTMGGYPHVAQVISADLDRIGQARPGTMLRFQFVESDEAIRIHEVRTRAQTGYLARLRVATRDGIVPSTCEPSLFDLG